MIMGHCRVKIEICLLMGTNVSVCTFFGAITAALTNMLDSFISFFFSRPQRNMEYCLRVDEITIDDNNTVCTLVHGDEEKKNHQQQQRHETISVA